MRRKTTTAPTRIYTYGCLPPVEGADLVDEQLWRAHRYRNALVEIERERRERVAAAQRAHDVLGPLLEVIENTETAVAEARVEARLTHSGGDDVARRAALREMIEAAQADLSVLRAIRACAKAVACQDEMLRAAYAEIEEWATAQVKALRAGDRRDRRGDLIQPPYWGTYLVVEKAAEAWRRSADAPKFWRYDGQGRVAVQLQGGLTVGELLGGEDMRLRVLPSTQMRCPVDPQTSRQCARAVAYGVVSFCRAGDMAERGSHRAVRLRVGSSGRAPVWATFPIVLHRDLPADGRITWAWVIRRRCGARYRYELQVVVEAESFVARTAAQAGTVAVDVGSRDLPDGGVRAAYWLDWGGSRGEVVQQTTRLSSATSRGRGRRREVPSGLDKCEDLQSIRSKNLDAVKAALVAHRSVASSEWLAQATERVGAWRSPARFAALYRRWQRHDGDGQIYELLGDYVRQDRHLSDWETSERRRYLARRREQYRVFAAGLARRYAVIAIASRDYRREEWVPEQAPSTRAHESRKIMRGAAPGELREEIRRAAKKYGAAVVEVELEGDTAWCLDYRVCERLLASDEAVRGGGQPLASAKRHNHYGTSESFKRRRLGTAENVDPLAGHDVAT